MNRTAYFTTDIAIKTLAKLIKAKTIFHGLSNIPDGPIIFVINHFTRLETLLLPYYLYHLTKTHIWSLADDGLFKGGLKSYFDRVGVVSTRDPQRDKLIIKTLLTGKAHWIIFPEGRMVKNKKLIRRGKYLIGDDYTVRSPHTGAASISLRAEIFRRFLQTDGNNIKDCEALRKSLEIETDEQISEKSLKIVPVNITYYPIRANDNFFSELAARYVKEPSERMIEELMTEGSMILGGIDLDICFGRPLDTAEEINHPVIQKILAGPVSDRFDAYPKNLKHLQKIAGKMMQTYMARIYSGTTINHDHIFASLLRKKSFWPFWEDSLARSVFLVSDFVSSDTALEKSLHADLMESQVHLLVDDRYKKKESFLDLGVETTCLIPVGKKYKKNPSCWKQATLFHRARVENPVEVMANEVEPLPGLQKYIRRVSMMPDFLVRILIANRLQLKGVDEYKNERAGCGKNVEFEYKTGCPFILPAFSRKVGVVFVHSYLSVPAEIRQCARLINKQGAWVYGVRLPGHGTNPESLEQNKWENWRDSVERGFALINSICRNVILIGFSAGGSLVLELSSRLDSVAGVAAICPPYELKDYSKRFMPPVAIWNRLLTRWKTDHASAEFVDFEPEARELNYNRNPVSGVNEVGKLLDACKERLPKISHRTLIVSADKDQVVGDRGGRAIFDRLGSKEKELVIISSKRHNIINGPDTARNRAIIAAFVKDCI